MRNKVNKIFQVSLAPLVKNKILHAPKMLFAKTRTSKQALILFTRLPVAGKTKTRLIPYLGKKGARDIHLALLQDFAKLYWKLHRKEKEVKLFLFFSSATANEIVEGAFDSGKKESNKEQEGRNEGIAEMKILRKLFPDAEFVPQEGEDIFRKMEKSTFWKEVSVSEKRKILFACWKKAGRKVTITRKISGKSCFPSIETPFSV